MVPESNFLVRMADGTIKQTNPFTGNEVWTVPGRGSRPLVHDIRNKGQRLNRTKLGIYCTFCPGNYLKTPPEKARLVRDGKRYITIRDLSPDELFDTVAEFRRVPNLFEIVSFDYWQKNFGHELPESVTVRKQSYLSTEAGRKHVFGILDQRMKLANMTEAVIRAVPEEDKLEMANAFFGGGHELIIANRHYIAGAEYESDLASSGSLTPEEHYQYMRFTIDAARDIYLNNRYARYVAIFQNWLSPAGASFDHLHKQLVAIDERGVQNDWEVRLARANPNMYNEFAVNYAGYRNLVFAENDYAIAFADFGHRFPTLAIYSKSERSQPWNHTPEELRGMSDIIHGCHAAMGSTIPCNEEWYYKPPDADVPMPWRVLIKWRVSNPAGFEGGTKIYVNTIDPESLRDKVVPRLFELKNAGKIAYMKIAFECDCEPNCLKYNPAVRQQTTEETVFPPLSAQERRRLRS